MIIVRLQGGLGNQLFIYSAYKKIAGIFDNVYLDVSDYYLPFNVGYRKLLLSGFEAEYKSVTSLVVSRLFCDNYITLKKKLELEQINYHLNINNYLNPDLFNNLKNNSYVEGFFSNEICFDKTILKSKIKFKKQIDGKYGNIMQDIQSDNSVSIHIRMGDYKNIPDYKICTKDYYKNAINYISEKIEKPVFYVFSDEINKAKEYFIGFDNVKFVNCNDTISSLMLMSNCKHNIIANSTFSWWGAWLNNFKYKIVVCPSRYNLSKPYTPYLDNWIHIS
ncbi:alpha-1,2-fucosyltransferase [Spirochaetia bacterium]|nr:alpha-1,2-fucosyltransferase [Spirochaetia bacterium]